MAKKRTPAQLAADKRRTGRPRKERTDKQSERVMVYLTPSEYERLQTLAEEAGISLAAQIMMPWREEDQ